MHYHPFTHEQAGEIAEDFEDLMDTEFRHDGVSYLIDHVVVSPFAEGEKQQFMSSFETSRPLENVTQSEGYDVMIFATDDNGRILWLNIRTFVEQRGIGYNFPE